jgi:hypothetical protein
MDDTFDEARRLLAGLVTGVVGREEAADWAMERIKDEKVDYHKNRALWTALDQLGGADLKVAPDAYLHGREDFESWLAQADESSHD